LELLPPAELLAGLVMVAAAWCHEEHLCALWLVVGVIPLEERNHPKVH
jgi:hypothetical protein